MYECNSLFTLNTLIINTHDMHDDPSRLTRSDLHLHSNMTDSMNMIGPQDPLGLGSLLVRHMASSILTGLFHDQLGHRLAT